MSLTENKKLFQVILGVTVMIVAVLIFSIFTVLKKSDDEETSLSPNTIVPPQQNAAVPQSIEQLKKAVISNPLANNNGDLLLHQAENFYIEYITAPNVFFVKISKDAQKSKQEAQEWFLEKGFKQEDLCTISVRFVLANFEIRRENPDFSSLPDGCSGQTVTRE